MQPSGPSGTEAPPGVILAGGLGRRLGGGGKAGVMLAGRSLLQRVEARFAPQVGALAVNANALVDTACPVLPDPVPGHPGPLAGILVAMGWAAGRGASHVVTVAVDTPFLPCDLVPRLTLAAEGHARGLAIAADSSGLHPVFGLWPVALQGDLHQALDQGLRKVADWTDRHAPAIAHFPDRQPAGFFNINRPEDLQAAEDWIA